MAELTCEAKDAIRTYLLKYAVPSGALVALIAGFGGYVLTGLARLEAQKEAMEAARQAAVANANATLAASQASEARGKAEASAQKLNEIYVQMDSVRKGQMDSLAEALLTNQDFRERIVRAASTEVKEIQVRFESLSRSGVLASGSLKGGQISSQSKGLIYDPATGRVSFSNPRGAKFVPLVSYVSPNGSTVTQSCWVKTIETASFVLGEGAQDTSGRSFPPRDCTFAVVGTGE